MKVCSKCKQEKSLDQFYKNQRWCKDCKRVAQQERDKKGKRQQRRTGPPSRWFLNNPDSVWKMGQTRGAINNHGGFKEIVQRDEDGTKNTDIADCSDFTEQYDEMTLDDFEKYT
jgi:hypothetical protein